MRRQLWYKLWRGKYSYIKIRVQFEDLVDDRRMVEARLE